MDEGTQPEPRAVAIVGDEAFAAAVANHKLTAMPARPEPTPDNPQAITVDAHGNIVGDTSKIDPHILEQLMSPESQAKIKAMYRQSRYGTKEPPRQPRFLTEGTTRDLRQHQLMPGKLGRKLRRQYLRKISKIVTQGEHHGRQPDQPAAGNSPAGQ